MSVFPSIISQLKWFAMVFTGLDGKSSHFAVTLQNCGIIGRSEVTTLRVDLLPPETTPPAARTYPTGGVTSDA